jgi:hypothetical protein
MPSQALSKMLSFFSFDNFVKETRQESSYFSQAWWLTSVISATREIEIGRLVVRGQLGQKISKIPSQQQS